MYTFQSRVRYSELNHQRGLLTSSSIINYFQDCSTFQSEDMNRGLEYLQNKNRVWLLNSWQLQIFHPVHLGDNIIIGTWANDFKGFYGYRNFVMKDDTNKVFAAANSIWVYLDTETGKPTKIPDDHAGYQLEPPYPMEPCARKINIPDHYNEYPSFPVIKSNIDSYHHVNNGQYIKMAEEYLPNYFYPSSMRAEYRAQAVLGDMIIPKVSKEGDCYTIILADLNGKPYSIVQFQGKHVE